MKIKNYQLILLSVIFGMVLIQSIAWMSGNDNYYKHEDVVYVSPLEAKKPDPNKRYYYKTVVVETVTPSRTPLMFESKFDTITKTGLRSKNR